MLLKKKILSLLGSALLVALSACESHEVPTTVKVGPGQSFSFNGSGRLATFTVYAPIGGQKIAFPHNDVSSVIWQIATSKGYFHGARVDALNLAFGKTPEGYRQTVPDQANVPALQPGMIYSFFAETTGAGVASGSFYVEKSGAMFQVTTDLCLTLKNGHHMRVSCKTGEPYHEPTDLEKFAHEHQGGQ